jgi:hypothetical protein
MSLLKPYLEKYPIHYESPLNSCINFITHSNRNGIQIKKELQSEIKAIISSELKKSKIDGYSNFTRGLPLRYSLSYIEKFFKLHNLRKIISIGDVHRNRISNPPKRNLMWKRKVPPMRCVQDQVQTAEGRPPQASQTYMRRIQLRECS